MTWSIQHLSMQILLLHHRINNFKTFTVIKTSLSLTLHPSTTVIRGFTSHWVWVMLIKFYYLWREVQHLATRIFIQNLLLLFGFYLRIKYLLVPLCSSILTQDKYNWERMDQLQTFKWEFMRALVYGCQLLIGLNLIKLFAIIPVGTTCIWLTLQIHWGFTLTTSWRQLYQVW